MWFDIASALSTQSILLVLLAVVAGIVLAKTPIGYMVFATGGNRRAAEYAGIDTDKVRFWSLVFSSACASLAGLIYIAYFRSFNPSAGQLRELDVIAAVIIGGGLDLRRLRLDPRRARRCGGDHAAARPALAPDHPARRHAR